MLQQIFFFEFWGAEMHVFHIVPFCPTRYVLTSVRCLEFSSRVRNWNKVKNIIYVKSKLLLSQMDLPIFINQLMCQSSLIKTVSFVFCEFYRVSRWNETKTIILVQSSFQIPKYKHWCHIQGQPLSMKTCLFLVVIWRKV